MKNIKLLIEYDGTDYHGWQTQKEKRTLQRMIEEALFRITGERVKLIGAARTDAGVHAFGQVAVFTTGSYLEPVVLQRALNAILIDDIRILSAVEADRTFHPRYDAVSKTYFYLIANMANTSTFLHRYAWRVPYNLDLCNMKEAGKLFQGRYDFSAFMGAGCGAKNKIREIHSIDIQQLNCIDFMTVKLSGNFIKISITANAFLRHMVRNIVGTLVDIGRGRMLPSAVSDALEHKDRKKTGPTAPAKGLFLEKIRY